MTNMGAQPGVYCLERGQLASLCINLEQVYSTMVGQSSINYGVDMLDSNFDSVFLDGF